MLRVAGRRCSSWWSSTPASSAIISRNSITGCSVVKTSDDSRSISDSNPSYLNSMFLQHIRDPEETWSRLKTIFYLQEVGVLHRRWHLWRRIYDFNEQFSVVENPGFWYWTFTLKDVNGEVLAEIDRDWRGFGFEVFTDAAQYVIRFGSDAATKGISELSKKVQEFEVARLLTLSERAVTVALAISLDNDYFSRH